MFFHRPLFLPENLEPHRNNLREKFQKYYTDGVSPPLQSNFIRHLKGQTPNDLSRVAAQIKALSSIPNFHLWNQLGQGGQLLKSEPKVNNAQRLLYHPLQDSEDPKLRFRYKPCSPRHQVAHFLQNNLDLKKLVRHMLSIDRGEGTSALPIQKVPRTPAPAVPTELIEHDYSQDEPAPPPPKRRKFGLRLRPLTVDVYCARHPEVNYTQVIENRTDTDTEMTLFEAFKQEVVARGTLQKRLVQDDRQVFLMNEYSLLTGHLQPNSFVHLTVSHTEENEKVVVCSCSAYEDLRLTANKGMPLPDRYQSDTSSLSYLHDDLTCMHARLYREELMYISEPPTNLQAKLKVDADDGRKVKLVDEAYPQATTKFSVAADRFAFVHLWFENGKCLVQCQDGTCMAECKRKRRIAKNNSN